MFNRVHSIITNKDDLNKEITRIKQVISEKRGQNEFKFNLHNRYK